MEFVKNFPFFTIILSLFCSVLCFALRGRKTRFVSYFLLAASAVLSGATLAYNLTTEPGYFSYRMGHYDAPIGNEISAGLLEPFFALLFEVVILLSLVGGSRRIAADVEESKQRFFYIMVNLTHAALCALCYTNDIYTAYVFIEICTIASCALLMSHRRSRALVAATRYTIFSLIGSSLVLIGIVLLYSTTGQLLFPQLYEAVSRLWAEGSYQVPLTVALGMIISGLAIKSGMFPFHWWMPDTYGAATPAASGILSGVVSKAYIFLLLKMIFRVIGFENFVETGIQNVLLVFGVCGMVVGSLSAIKSNNITFMTAYSSAAQIGYIYMGLGLGTPEALMASLFQIVAHSLTKPMLFLSAAGLTETVDGRQDFDSLRSSARWNPSAAAGFTVGALSLVGIPVFAGFVPKLLFAISAFGHGAGTYVVLIALAVSTILNVVYFLRTLVNIYSPPIVTLERRAVPILSSPAFSAAVLIMAAVNLAVGLHSQPLVTLLERGVTIFMSLR